MRLAIAFSALAVLALPAAVRANAVHFNHGYVNVTPATFDAITKSRFVIDELGAAESRTVAASGSNPGWSGFYIYGERTYLELFPASAGDPLGKIGLGLSIDDRTQLPVVAKRLSTAAGVPFGIGKQTRSIEGVKADWFDATGGDYGTNANPLLDSWVMALYPTYLRTRYPTLTAAEGGVTRDKALARQYKPDRLLKNVSAISLALTIGERARLLKELGGAGYAITRRGTMHEAVGPDVRFVLSTASPHRPRSITYHLSLNRAARPRAIKLGDSTFTVRPGASATWHFPAGGAEVK